MTQVCLLEDLQAAETLWRRHYPRRVLFDLWPVRASFQTEFNHPPCFLVATRDGHFCGMLALSWIEESRCFGHFPGEVWQQKTWLEQNRFIAADPEAAHALLERIPDGGVNIRYLVPEHCLPAAPVTEIDEIGYLFHPWRYDYSFHTYLQTFSGKSRKKMRRERERLQLGGVSIRHDRFSDIDHLFDLNLGGFGESSYFKDTRFLHAFENLAVWLKRNRLLRITTILVGGRVAAVDMSAVFNGTYTVLAGGTHTDFPGIAKLINFNHLEWACRERIREVDFLCGDFNWKQRFHLTPGRFSESERDRQRISDRPMPIRELPVRDSAKVLVVGTTTDYIDWIRRVRPGRVLFMTDPALRRKAVEPNPRPDEEFCCDLSNVNTAHRALAGHLRHFGLCLEGIVAFDCESIELAAHVAHRFSLPYPSVHSVRNCRDKHRSKTIWKRHGLFTPKAHRVCTPAEAVRFFRTVAGPCILKPLSGSGSELIFRCDSEADCHRHFIDIATGLWYRRNHPLYPGGSTTDGPVLLAEEFVEGIEYSCDFLLEAGTATPIRLTKKILAGSDYPPGTAVGYHLTSELPSGFDEAGFGRWLRSSATVLGFTRAICMVDFILSRDRTVLLEIAPRPGGDCLPFLLRRALGLDMLAFAVDFARRQPLSMNSVMDSPNLLGLRVHAQKSGALKRIDTSMLADDGRVREIRLTRPPGHIIRMPPVDYDSWLMGHILFEPDPGAAVSSQCRQLLAKIVMEVECVE